MKSSLEHLDELFKLLKLMNIEEPPELAEARAVIEELMKVSESYAAAMAEISNKMQAAAKVPTFVLPPPDPAVEKQIADVQAKIAEVMRPREPWEKLLDGALIQ